MKVPSAYSGLALAVLGWASLPTTTNAADAGLDDVSPQAQVQDQSKNQATGADGTAFVGELLDLAYEAASAFPLDPHIKNRSRAQSEVVEGALAVEDPDRALRFVEGIENWRRGLGYADCGFYFAERGRIDEAKRLLALAEAQLYELKDEQAWRRDRIRVRIAQTFVMLGDEVQAAKFRLDLEPSERGKIAGVEARVASDDAYDAQIKAIETAQALGEFDALRNVLFSATELYSRYYDAADRRKAIAKRIEAAWLAMPRRVLIDLMLRLSEIAADHRDPKTALAWADRAQAEFELSSWSARDHVPLLAMIALARHRAGEPNRARSEAEAARTRFQESRDKIVNIYRADALIPLAESLASMGDPGAGLEVYRLALTEAVVNPNSRPRTDDLVAICCSLVRLGLRPDEALWAQIRQTRDGLGNPW